MKIITKFKDRFSYPIKHQKEKIVIAITLICFLISGFSLPSIRAAYGIEPVEDTITQQDSDSKDANTVQTKKAKKTEKKKEDKEETDKEDIEESDKEDTEEVAEAQKDSDNDGKNEKSSEKKGSENSASDTASSNNNAGSSGSSENTPAPAPPPQKVWVPPVYQTIHHDAVYNTVKVVVCNYCGAEFGFSQVNSRYTRMPMVDDQGLHTTCRYASKQVLVQAAWDEQVLVQEGYYK